MNLNIANTIVAQLGGNRFIAMTGCKNFGGDSDGVTFHMPQRMCKNKAKYCTIKLDVATDTYTVKFQKTVGGKFGSLVDVSTHALVYGDRLATLFSEVTGLAVSL
jgi:hypothetical protein